MTATLAPVDPFYQAAYLTLRNGGGTFTRDTARDASLPGRYIVALGAPYERVTSADIRSIALALQELSYSGQGHALGTWLHEGKAYVDVVESFSDRTLAMQLARSRSQLAIFDTVTSDSIDTDQLVRV